LAIRSPASAAAANSTVRISPATSPSIISATIIGTADSRARASAGGRSDWPVTASARQTVATIRTGSGQSLPPKAGEAIRKAPIRSMTRKNPASGSASRARSMPGRV
jgi:hypothetical protein